ncbi:MAG: GntR family transcriptional regulator [Burkholderiales bacterium RIFCSPHIGHO2_12_FULL_61_11]|nr:MAG: GntR family transcriptional regulator [Burkholderiales bacterium RIFCSPHIGHO2_12_FULL_61_11]
MTKPLGRIKAETLRAQVENHLRQAIVSGQLKAGEKLVERQLCEMMGVSRPSLREALRKLEAEKLIVNVPHRGPEVASITLDEARDLYALRRLLESYAAHEFTRLASAEEMKSLAKTVKHLREAGQKNSREGVLKAKAEFYGILLGGCGNLLVSEILGGLLSRVSLLRSTSLMLPDRLPRSLEEIDSLLECIQNRDAKGAQKIAHKHVLNAEIAALGVFEQQMSS